MSVVKRFFVKKQETFAWERQMLLAELKGMFVFAETKLKEVDIWHSYDIEADLSQEQWRLVQQQVLAEVNADIVLEGRFLPLEEAIYFAYSYLPGQYDQRADSATQCILAVTERTAKVRCGRFVGLVGQLKEDEINRIKDYLINAVDSTEVSQETPRSLSQTIKEPDKLRTYEGFFSLAEDELKRFHEQHGLAMNLADLSHCQTYFKEIGRQPTETELKVIDTYWSDHCRHTTFATVLSRIDWQPDEYLLAKKQAYQTYLTNKQRYTPFKPVTLMSMATLGMVEMQSKGQLANLDLSPEINACSIRVPVSYQPINSSSDEMEKMDYLIQFKNETHNHPTEIEPFGGAATCLGGAIRDPLSGRAYVYGGMRISGAADPRESSDMTLSGKLPQRKISTGAADGYSSYGNQIGLATGEVREYYHPRFKAKRMELGAVIGAVPAKNVRREEPLPGDLVVVLGGATGRDGCGGATGSSKAHRRSSLDTAGAEVQKGNPPEERKLQRLFRNPDFSLCIKRCNDFGAGGVAVAIGELADGLIIELDALTTKYEGLTATELAISESQERMAIVIETGDLNKVIDLAAAENVTAVKVATVTDERRLRMFWEGQEVLNLERDFLATNGVLGEATVSIPAIDQSEDPFRAQVDNQLEGDASTVSWGRKYCRHMAELNQASQICLTEKFDSTVGRGTVLLPYGGRNQTSKVDGMVLKVPVLGGNSQTVTYMTHGYDPELAVWSPFHGAIYSAVLAVSKAVSLGCDYRCLRLSCQEYFERLGNQPERWGRPTIALLGSYYFQNRMGLASIGGKDSMSGSFEELDVPPTVVTFAVGYGPLTAVQSPEWKEIGSAIIHCRIKRDDQSLPDFEELHQLYQAIFRWQQAGLIRSTRAVDNGGLAAALANACFGNQIGLELVTDSRELWQADYGSLLMEVAPEVWQTGAERFKEVGGYLLAYTSNRPVIQSTSGQVALTTLEKAWKQPLAEIFKTVDEAVEHSSINKPLKECSEQVSLVSGSGELLKKMKSVGYLNGRRPRVLIPVFPGTNCDYDMQKAFEVAGAEVTFLVVRNRCQQDLKESINEWVTRLADSQILALAGGFSAGDEPQGAGKYIAALLRQPLLATAVNEHVKQKKGLIIGICNGFQALIKSGLLPYGQVTDLATDSPTLTFNRVGRHMATMVTTEVCPTDSAWASGLVVGQRHRIAISHGEGRFYATNDWLIRLNRRGQIFSRYVDEQGRSYQYGRYNPNGSTAAIEGLVSPDGLILGKMGHSERYEAGLFQNISGQKEQAIFAAGVTYFKG